MKKRGQVTLFFILGIIIVVIAGFYYYLKSHSTTQKSTKTVSDTFDSINAIKTYAEFCLKTVSDEEIFRVGHFGGYLNPYGDPNYGEPGIPDGYPVTYFLENKIPYYIAAYGGQGSPPTYKTFIPSIESIKTKLANSIIVEFDKCFKNNTFKDFDMDVIAPEFDLRSAGFDFSKTDVNIDVGLNAEDVSVNLHYPIVAQKDDNKIEFSEFKVTVPIRLKALYDGASIFVDNAKNNQPNQYDFTTDCVTYDKNGLTNVYLKSSQDGPDEIVQFVDFSTYGNHYLKSYLFQFAVRDLNIKGRCAG